jgi:hypothetical protein
MRMAKDEWLYTLLAGLAVGAVAVYIVMNEISKTSIMELTRDDKGHVVSIIQRRV